MRVLLPQPEAPMMERNDPSGTAMEILRNSALRSSPLPTITETLSTKTAAAILEVIGMFKVLGPVNSNVAVRSNPNGVMITQPRVGAGAPTLGKMRNAQP